jgi:phosphohistidine phosphatase
MPTLYLLRHAKSSWDDPSLPDLDRPLAARGRRACARLRDYCNRERVRPELVICSTALRARETLAAVIDGLGSPMVRLDDRLYHASCPTLLALVQELEAASAMLVGHNPGLQDTLLALARPSAVRDRAAVKLPTGALATLQLETWSAVRGDVTALVVPRDLA